MNNETYLIAKMVAILFMVGVGVFWICGPYRETAKENKKILSLLPLSIGASILIASIGMIYLEFF